MCNVYNITQQISLSRLPDGVDPLIYWNHHRRVVVLHDSLVDCAGIEAR